MGRVTALRGMAVVGSCVLALAACGSGSPASSGRAQPAPTERVPVATADAPQPSSSRLPPAAETDQSPTVARIAQLGEQVAADPSDADAQRDLGFALAQRVRETADPSLYAPALDAFDAALRLRRDDARAAAGVASIQLGKHQFADALRTARHVIELSPSLVAARAAEVDALVELARYDEADAAAAEMLGLSADITTLARVSYLAELRGRLPAAIAAMRQAAASPGLAPENTAYVDALLGNLLVWSGDGARAAEAYAAAL